MNSINDIFSLEAVVTLYLLYLGILIVRSNRKMLALLKNYVLEITDKEINRRINDNAYIYINSATVKEVIKFKNGAYLVVGPDKKQIMIPQMLDDTGNLERQLLALAPIRNSNNDPLNLKYRWTMLLLTAAICGCANLSGNRTMITTAVAMAVGLVLLASYHIRYNKNLYATAKRGAWFYFIVLGIAILIGLSKLVPSVN